MAATTPILGIDQVAEDQNSKHITINDAIIALESAANAAVELDLASGDYEMTEGEFTASFVFEVTGLTTDRLLTVPDAVNSIDADRVIFVLNNSAYDLSVEAGSSAANTVLMPAATGALMHVAANTITVLLTQGAVGASSDEVIMGLYLPGQPDNGAEVFRHVFPRGVSFAANFSGSRGSVSTNPTAAATFGISKNGGNVGSVQIGTGGAFTFSSSGGSPVSFAAGDIMTITAPSPQDGTLADIGITLFGSKD